MKKVKHLILLVGSNPLPNAVAGKLLVESGGVISLIHSKHTAEIADRLKNWLENEHKKEGTVNIRMQEVNESQPPSIYRGVIDILNEVNEKSIGLNYTGGTKMMSVHAYQTVIRWAKENDTIPVFSYLDARTLEMVFDPTDKYSREGREYVGLKVEMVLEDLLGLHDWKLGKPEKRHFELSETAKIIADKCGEIDGFVEKYKAFKNNLSNKDFLEKPDNDHLKQIYEKLHEELQVECKELCKPDGNIKLTDELRDWLKGYWLESYLFHILNHKLREKLHLRCYKNIITEEPRFEVDAVAIRGYQLFAFSCKTQWNDKKELKKALFEIYIRAKQLGGDEARLALVCLAEDPENIEKEIRKDFDLEKKVKVFGRKHLLNLEIYLENWMRKQSGGE